MKYKLLTFFLGCSVSMFAQDIINTRYNATIKGKVLDVKPTTLTYEKPDNPGHKYLMDLGDVTNIKFENGEEKSFTTDLFYNLDLTQTQQQLIELFKDYAFIHEKDLKKIHLAFSDNFLIATQCDDSGKPIEKTSVYLDFTQVVSFMSVSKRDNDMGYLNLYIMGKEKLSDKKFEKKKFVLMVRPLEKAYDIYHTLKHLNILLDKK